MLSHLWSVLQREFIETTEIWKNNATNAFLPTIDIFVVFLSGRLSSIPRPWPAQGSSNTARSPVAASAERTWPGRPTIRQERKWLIDGTVKLRTTTSSSLASPPGQDTSRPWCGRIQRRWEWGRRLQVMGPPSWWPDTSQQGMSSTRATLKKTSCLRRSNWCNVTGRRQT